MSKSHLFISLHQQAEAIFQQIEDTRVKEMVTKCFFNTIDTTCKFLDDGKVFVITGDIPAMWLRDSSAQVMQYINFADDEETRNLIKGVLLQQFEFIELDPYANAFMENSECISEWDGQVDTNYLHPQVWERKFELDSLCYPLFLLYKYILKTNDTSILNDSFYRAFDIIVATIQKEQNHELLSDYYFRYLNREIQRIPKPKRESVGPKSGLVWSGFRPSDDICTYHYHIPDNILAVSVFDKLAAILANIGQLDRAETSKKIRDTIQKGIEDYGVVNMPGIGKVYVSETDCLGHFHIDDDANIPSLLSIPYMEYPYIDKEIYSNTRNYILSKKNKYYFEGSRLKGIGSPHTPGNNVWPLALIMQGLTTENKKEIASCCEMLINNDADTSYMHESINVDDPKIYTRKWFAWANSLFSQFVIEKIINK